MQRLEVARAHRLSGVIHEHLADVLHHHAGRTRTPAASLAAGQWRTAERSLFEFCAKTACSVTGASRT